MNFKNSIYSTLTLIISLTYSCVTVRYVEYKPHYLSVNNENKYYGEAELDSLELRNVIQVLEFYEEDYKLKENNIVLITKKLNRDWELVWNYTIKSKDKKWLEANKPNR